MTTKNSQEIDEKRHLKLVEKLPILCFLFQPSEIHKSNLEFLPSESVGVVVTPSQLHVNPVLGCGGSIETILLAGKHQGTG